MNRAFNFSAGPSTLPQEVLEKIQQELLNWQGTGASVMEIGHRSSEFMDFADKLREKFVKILQIPDSHEILFCSGGASTQNAMIPLNLLGNKKSADYLVTGLWSNKAWLEANKYCTANLVANGKENNFTSIPERSSWQVHEDAAYFHYASNETVHGLQFHEPLQGIPVPLVADMSSDIMSKPIDIYRYGLIYAGAQKNLSTPGLTILIIRRDLLDRARHDIPLNFHYDTLRNMNSMPNTPVTFSWYIADLMLDWLEKQGGLSAMAQASQRKSQKLYTAIDKSDFYINHVVPKDRSLMNVLFYLHDDKLTPLFVSEATANGLISLKGHRDTGGIRASLYNAMPEKGVDALVSFMNDFEKTHG